MEIAESFLLTISLILMIVALFASIIPFLPGPILVWGIGLAAAYLTNFERVTPVASIVMTLLMLAGATTPYWLPFFGVRDEGLSCLGAVGSIIGGLLGTFLIPIPILGTIIGSIIGTLLVEFARIREMRRALRAGQIAFRMYMIGILVDMTFSLVIIIVFAVSAWSTG
jgi:uncharacterized protein YqgC (DUF456 family)